MKHINIIVLSVAICIGGIAFFLVCRYTYESKKSELNEKAKESFIKAFGQELKSRRFERYYSFNYDTKTLFTADIPDSVYFEDESGRHWYQLDPKKHRMNVSDDANVRSLHSMTFKEEPIEVDSLNSVWNKYLQEYNINAKSALGVSITGNDKAVKSIYSFQSELCSLSNLVFTVYVGYACEIEVVGYLQYSIWRMMWMEILLYLLLYAVCICLFYKISIVVVMKVTSMRQKEIIEVPVIELVQGVSDIPVRSYILCDNVLFYAEQRMIKINEIRKKMPLQACLLLELFLNSKDHIVTDAEIMNTLWPDGSGHLKRVHKAVARLRTYLMTDSPIRIERENLDTYQLIV